MPIAPIAPIAPSAATRRLLALLALLLTLACGGPPKEQPLPRGSRVVALGDSLTAAHGVRPAEAWPALLAELTGWEVINGGVSGDTSEGGLQRLPALLDEYRPALVLVTLGGNDMLRRVPQEQTMANLGRIIAQVRAHGARVVLVATPKPSLAGAAFGALSPADFYRTVARDQQVPLIEDPIADVLSEAKLKADQLHPNAAGHALLAKKLLAALKTIGYVR